MKKPFFQEDTVGKIKKKQEVEISELADVASLNNSQYAIIPTVSLIPRGFENARKFMKHGREVKPTRFYSQVQAEQDRRTPVQLREEVFNSISRHDFCAYSIMPIGRDKRKRKISLTECLEGSRIFAFSHQIPNESIIIKPYADAKRVRRDGAEIVASVPSRTKGKQDLELKLLSIPVIDSPEKYKISLDFGSDHSCGLKRFNIRYRYIDDKESSGVFNVCGHEIAVYLKVIEYYWNEQKNVIPMQMCQFAIPTQETVDYYLKWGNNVLIFDESLKKKDKLRKPNKAEREIGLWAIVEVLGHDRTFYSKKSRDKDVADYNWDVLK